MKLAGVLVQFHTPNHSQLLYYKPLLRFCGFGLRSSNAQTTTPSTEDAKSSNDSGYVRDGLVQQLTGDAGAMGGVSNAQNSTEASPLGHVDPSNIDSRFPVGSSTQATDSVPPQGSLSKSETMNDGMRMASLFRTLWLNCQHLQLESGRGSAPVQTPPEDGSGLDINGQGGEGGVGVGTAQHAGPTDSCDYAVCHCCVKPAMRLCTHNLLAPGGHRRISTFLYQFGPPLWLFCAVVFTHRGPSPPSPRTVLIPRARPSLILRGSGRSTASDSTKHMLHCAGALVAGYAAAFLRVNRAALNQALQTHPAHVTGVTRGVLREPRSDGDIQDGKTHHTTPRTGGGSALEGIESHGDSRGLCGECSWCASLTAFRPAGQNHACVRLQRSMQDTRPPLRPVTTPGTAFTPRPAKKFSRYLRRLTQLAMLREAWRKVLVPASAGGDAAANTEGGHDNCSDNGGDGGGAGSNNVAVIFASVIGEWWKGSDAALPLMQTAFSWRATDSHRKAPTTVRKGQIAPMAVPEPQASARLAPRWLNTRQPLEDAAPSQDKQSHAQPKTFGGRGGDGALLSGCRDLRSGLDSCAHCRDARLLAAGNAVRMRRSSVVVSTAGRETACDVHGSRGWPHRVLLNKRRISSCEVDGCGPDGRRADTTDRLRSDDMPPGGKEGALLRRSGESVHASVAGGLCAAAYVSLVCRWLPLLSGRAVCVCGCALTAFVHGDAHSAGNVSGRSDQKTQRDPEGQSSSTHLHDKTDLTVRTSRPGVSASLVSLQCRECSGVRAVLIPVGRSSSGVVDGLALAVAPVDTNTIGIDPTKGVVGAVLVRCGAGVHGGRSAWLAAARVMQAVSSALRRQVSADNSVLPS